MADVASIQEMITEGHEESLHLEFKTLTSDSQLTRDDRKMIAKAISGFANAEGGRLIIGIETRRSDGVDVAQKTRPVQNLTKMRGLLAAALPEILSPQHTGLTLTPVPAAATADEGFLVIDVEPSNNRPHMSVPERRYFRRGSDGTRVLDHAEIRELMFAAREAALSIDWTLRFGASTGDLKFALNVVLALRNEGRVPVVAPYVRMRSGPSRFAPLTGLQLNSRPSGDDTYGIYCPRDVLVHLQDQIWIAECVTGLDFSRTGHHELAQAVKVARESNMSHTYSMAPWDVMHGQNKRPADQLIQVEGFYGAENAPTKEFSFAIDKTTLLAKFCERKNIA